MLGSVEASFLAAAFDAISADYGDLESYFSDGLGLGTPASVQGSRRATWNPEFPPIGEGQDARLRRRFQFGIEVGDDVLECRDRLLNRGDLHQFPAADRAVAVLQRDNQIPPLLLELNQRQTVVRQISHRLLPTPGLERHAEL